MMNTTTITRTVTTTNVAVHVRLEQNGDCAPIILTVRDLNGTLMLNVYTDDFAPFHLDGLFTDADILAIQTRLAIALH